MLFSSFGPCEFSVCISTVNVNCASFSFFVPHEISFFVVQISVEQVFSPFWTCEIPVCIEQT